MVAYIGRFLLTAKSAKEGMEFFTTKYMKCANPECFRGALTRGKGARISEALLLTTEIAKSAKEKRRFLATKKHAGRKRGNEDWSDGVVGNWEADKDAMARQEIRENE